MMNVMSQSAVFFNTINEEEVNKRGSCDRRRQEVDVQSISMPVPGAISWMKRGTGAEGRWRLLYPGRRQPVISCLHVAVTSTCELYSLWVRKCSLFPRKIILVERASQEISENACQTEEQTRK
jgi:hypothetical protein